MQSFERVALNDAVPRLLARRIELVRSALSPVGRDAEELSDDDDAGLYRVVDACVMYENRENKNVG